MCVALIEPSNSQEESFAILMNISSPGSWKMPMHMNCQLEQRKPPQEDAMLFHDLDDRIKYYCKRPMMQEPNCLNTSILDCAVTFTVDKDICVHGIEVPSQVLNLHQRVQHTLESPDNNFSILQLGDGLFGKHVTGHPLHA